MKKLLAISFFVVLLFSPQIATATGPQEEPIVQPRGHIPTSFIDGIEIPYDVLEYAQMTYEGHAVTRAYRITRNSQQFYLLRVDKDDLANDYSSIMLIYDLNWKLIGEEKMAAPPVVKRPAEVKKVEPVLQPTDSPSDNETKTQPKEDDDKEDDSTPTQGDDEPENPLSESKPKHPTTDERP